MTRAPLHIVGETVLPIARPFGFQRIALIEAQPQEISLAEFNESIANSSVTLVTEDEDLADAVLFNFPDENAQALYHTGPGLQDESAIRHFFPHLPFEEIFAWLAMYHDTREKHPSTVLFLDPETE